MTAEKHAGYRVDRVDNEAGLSALRKDWDRLLAESYCPTIFLTWEWITSWWRHRAYNEGLWILIAREPGGQIAGIAPWMLRCQPSGLLRIGMLCIRRLGFIGSGIAYPAHLDFVARPQDKQGVTSAFLYYLEEHRGEWDVVDLVSLSEESLLGPGIVAGHGVWRSQPAVVAPYIPLPATWELYEREMLPATHSQQIRARRRRLLRDCDGLVAYEKVTTHDALGPALDDLTRLSQRRWSEKGMASSLEDAAFLAFLRDLAAVTLERGWLRLHLLRVNGEAIGVHLSFRYGDVIYGYQTAYALDWRKYRPGQLIQAHVIEEAIAEGAREFDLLQGAHEYKFFWTDQVRSDHHRLLSNGAPGGLWSLARVIYERSKRVARRLLPEPAQQRIERWLLARLAQTKTNASPDDKV